MSIFVLLYQLNKSAIFTTFIDFIINFLHDIILLFRYQKLIGHI